MKRMLKKQRKLEQQEQKQTTQSKNALHSQVNILLRIALYTLRRHCLH